jgi:hypothetical protein
VGQRDPASRRASVRNRLIGLTLLVQTPHGPDGRGGPLNTKSCSLMCDRQIVRLTEMSPEIRAIAASFNTRAAKPATVSSSARPGALCLTGSWWY